MTKTSQLRGHLQEEHARKKEQQVQRQDLASSVNRKKAGW